MNSCAKRTSGNTSLTYKVSRVSSYSGRLNCADNVQVGRWYISQTRLALTLMPSVNMLQAKSSLSRLVESIEQGREREIVIARNGRPAAKLVPVDLQPLGKRLGVAKGKFTVPDDIDAHNAEVAQLFLGTR